MLDVLNSSTALVLLALIVALVGAIRFDLFGLIWRNWLGMGRPKPDLPPPTAHGPYQAHPGAQGHEQKLAHKPADLHRRGKRH